MRRCATILLRRPSPPAHPAPGERREGMNDDKIFVIGAGGFDIRLSPELLARLRGEEEGDADAGEE